MHHEIKAVLGRSLRQVMTPHLSPIPQQLAALLMTAAALEAPCRHHSANIWHSSTHTNLSKESHMGPAGGGQQGRGGLHGVGLLKLVAVAHKQMRKT